MHSCLLPSCIAQWLGDGSLSQLRWPKPLPVCLISCHPAVPVSLRQAACACTLCHADALLMGCRIALQLRNLGFGAVPIHGQMSQPKRIGALHKFKSGDRSILVATGKYSA